MWERWQHIRRSRLALFVVPMVTMVGLLSLAIYSYGWPIDAYTWIALAAVLACSALPGLYDLRWRWAALTVLLGVYIAFPGTFLTFIPVLQRWWLCDDHGGRTGLEISPRLRFGHDGANTQLLESYLGPLPANWWPSAPNFPHIRDGNERVKTRSPIFRSDLPEMLAKLPNDAARKQVLTCLVDPENRLRIHQGLLFACVAELGYPPGLDAQSWWQAHREIFRCEYDPMVAAKMTRGWLRRIQRLPVDWDGAAGILIQAADYQEGGGWGGDGDFREAVSELEWIQRPRPVADSNNVLWWPSATEEMFGSGQITDSHLLRFAANGGDTNRSPLYFLYSEPEFVFHGMKHEPSPGDWPSFGKFEFKLDGRVTEVPLFEISEDELAVQVGQQTFRGLSKKKLLGIFRE